MAIWPIHSERHSYGYQKDKYNPKATYHCIARDIPPQSPNNLQYAPVITDQDGIGICGGETWEELVTWVTNLLGQTVPGGFSAWWFYNLARWKEGTLSQDSGLSNDDVAAMTLKFGCLPNVDWPWVVPAKLDTSAPSSARQSEAYKYPNTQILRVDGGVDGLRSAMAAKHAVAVGGPFFVEWENPPESGILPVPTSNSGVAGGHDTLWLDYDDSVNLFLAQNSWSDKWGKGGRFYVPYAAIQWMAQFGGWDGHIITFDKLPDPVPVPQPAGNCILDLFKKVKAEKACKGG